MKCIKYIYILVFIGICIVCKFLFSFKCMIDYVLYMLVVTINTFYISWGFKLHLFYLLSKILWIERYFVECNQMLKGKELNPTITDGNILKEKKIYVFLTLKINNFIRHNLNLFFFRWLTQSVSENSIVLLWTWVFYTHTHTRTVPSINMWLSKKSSRSGLNSDTILR